MIDRGSGLIYNNEQISNTNRLGEFHIRMQNAREEKNSVNVDPQMVWSVHLLHQEPKRLLLILPIVLVSLLAGYNIFHSLLSMAVILLLFVASLADFVFPVRYELTTEGAAARTAFSRTFIEWRRVRKYYVDDRGIKLSPLARQGRLEAYRGVYLRFGSNRDEVTAAVRRMRDDLSGTS